MTDGQPKTIVFGLDGAHFELIEPWMAEGELPNVARAIENGVRGDLESVLPPVTSPNWKSYATGKNPAKFGIFWWENVDVDEGEVYYPHERKHSETEFWELISEADGERPGVIGVPTTYPPKSVDEFLVAGAPDGKNKDYTYPVELEDRLERDHDYRVTIKNELRAQPDEAAEEILGAIDTRFTVARELFEEHDLTFLQATTFYINSLHHYFWDDEYTLRGWKVIDEHLGTFLDEGYDVVLMSDHGSNEIEIVFHVNTWLEEEGHLALDNSTARLMHRLGVNRDRLLRILSTFGLQDLAKRIAPQFLLDVVPDEQGQLIHESKTSNVDWPKTTVLASGQGPIYLTVDPDDPEYESIRQEIIDDLKALETPSGKPVARNVYRGEEVYEGPFLDEGPDLVIDQAPGIHIEGSVGRPEVFSDPEEDGWRGENKREGLFVATGPSFDTGDVGSLSILDLAPTLLHLRGHSVPDDMDGTVRKEVFAEDSSAAATDVDWVGVEDEEKERQRIRRAIRRIELP